MWAASRPQLAGRYQKGVPTCKPLYPDVNHPGIVIPVFSGSMKSRTPTTSPAPHATLDPRITPETGRPHPNPEPLDQIHRSADGTREGTVLAQRLEGRHPSGRGSRLRHPARDGGDGEGFVQFVSPKTCFKTTPADLPDKAAFSRETAVPGDGTSGPGGGIRPGTRHRQSLQSGGGRHHGGADAGGRLAGRVVLNSLE